MKLPISRQSINNSWLLLLLLLPCAFCQVLAISSIGGRRSNSSQGIITNPRHTIRYDRSITSVYIPKRPTPRPTDTRRRVTTIAPQQNRAARTNITKITASYTNQPIARQTTHRMEYTPGIPSPHNNHNIQKSVLPSGMLFIAFGIALSVVIAAFLISWGIVFLRSWYFARKEQRFQAMASRYQNAALYNLSSNSDDSAPYDSELVLKVRKMDQLNRFSLYSLGSMSSITGGENSKDANRRSLENRASMYISPTNLIQHQKLFMQSTRTPSSLSLTPTAALKDIPFPGPASTRIASGVPLRHSMASTKYIPKSSAPPPPSAYLDSLLKEDLQRTTSLN
ncbi:AaceriACL009Cp [[Ashbya] aceris (nom. inval.)]|nr:AaceriACL009Cp [[Ashbya] aceris (nom. inval.)]